MRLSRNRTLTYNKRPKTKTVMTVMTINRASCSSIIFAAVGEAAGRSPICHGVGSLAQACPAKFANNRTETVTRNLFTLYSPTSTSRPDQISGVATLVLPARRIFKTPTQTCNNLRSNPPVAISFAKQSRAFITAMPRHGVHRDTMSQKQ